MKVLLNAITSNSTVKGAERYIYELTRAISNVDRTNEYIIVTAPWQKYFPHIDKSNFKFYETRLPRKQILRNLWQALIFPFIAKKFNPDLIHLCNMMPLVIKVKPTVVTLFDLHEYYTPKTFNRLQVIYRKIMLRIIASRAECIFTISKFVSNAILQRCKRANIKITYLSVPSFDTNAKNNINADIQLPEKYILFVGAFEPHKNIVGIIRAFNSLKPDLKKEYNMVFVGKEGSASKDIWNEIKLLDLHQKVYYYSDVHDTTLKQIYSGASLFVFPSFTEGFGLPVLEAMKNGVPVISSTQGALPEVCSDAAILIDPNCTQDLTNAMERVLTDTNLAETLRKRGRERLKFFSWDKIAQEVLKSYLTYSS